jgi:hypothetical protein
MSRVPPKSPARARVSPPKAPSTPAKLKAPAAARSAATVSGFDKPTVAASKPWVPVAPSARVQAVEPSAARSSEAWALLDLVTASGALTDKIRANVPSDLATVDLKRAQAQGWQAAFVASALSSVGPGNPEPVRRAFAKAEGTLAELGRVLDGPKANRPRPDRLDGGVIDNPIDILTEADAVRLGAQALKARFPDATVRIVATGSGQGIVDRVLEPGRVLLELERKLPEGKLLVSHFRPDLHALQASLEEPLLDAPVQSQRAFLRKLPDELGAIGGFLAEEKPALDRVLVRVDLDDAGEPKQIQTSISGVPGAQKYFAYERAHAGELAAGVVNTYAEFVGTQGRRLSGEELVSTVGFALGAVPNNKQREGAAGQAVSAPFFVGEVRKAVELVSGQVEAAQRDVHAGTVSVLPVTVSPTEGLAAVVPLFKILGADGESRFVDHHGRRYASFKDWEQSNTLPPGVMTYPREGKFAAPPASTPLQTRNTPAVVDTLAEHAREIAVTGAEAALGLGAAVGIGAAMASGLGEPGLAAVAAGALAVGGAAAAAGGVVLVADSVAQLGDLALHHEDLNPISSPRARSHWLMIGAAATNVLAAGTSQPLLKAARSGLNALAIGDGGLQLGLNWDSLSWDQRAYQLLLTGYFAKGVVGELAGAGSKPNPGGGARKLETGGGDAPPPVPSPSNPKVLAEHANILRWTPIPGGKLYVDGISYDDVIQGNISDCYLMAAFCSIAYADPSLIEGAIRDLGHGNFDVRFHEAAYSGGPMEQLRIPVTAEVPMRLGDDSGAYGHSRDSTELWVSLMEKAYAKWKGGYSELDQGGHAHEVMSAVTGRASEAVELRRQSADEIFEMIQQAMANNRPVTAGTHAADSGVQYNGTGIKPWHVYSVFKGMIDEAGVKHVQLRNPWGDTVPAGNNTTDGTFHLKLDEFTKLYAWLHLGK